MWQPNAYYHVTYNGNGESVSNVPSDSRDYGPRETATVLGPGSMTNSGMYFLRWDTDSNGNGTPYREGDSLTMTDNITLYAIWSASPDSSDSSSSSSYYTLTYHSNGATGGTVPKDGRHYFGGEQVIVAAQGDLVRRGCTFLEWNTKPDGTGSGYHAREDILTMPHHSVTLYAIWLNDDGVIVYDSPGTGESALEMVLAIGTGLLSLSIAAWLFLRRRDSIYA